MNFGEKLYRLRTEHGICQKELAAYLHVAISTISNYENGVHSPDIKMLREIAQFFHVSVDYLLDRTEYVAPIAELDKELIDQYTVSSVMDTIIELSPERRQDLLKYTDMLKQCDAPDNAQLKQCDAPDNTQQNQLTAAPQASSPPS